MSLEFGMMRRKLSFSPPWCSRFSPLSKKKIIAHNLWAGWNISRRLLSNLPTSTKIKHSVVTQTSQRNFLYIKQLEFISKPNLRIFKVKKKMWFILTYIEYFIETPFLTLNNHFFVTYYPIRLRNRFCIFSVWRLWMRSPYPKLRKTSNPWKFLKLLPEHKLQSAPLYINALSL